MPPAEVQPAVFRPVDDKLHSHAKDLYAAVLTGSDPLALEAAARHLVDKRLAISYEPAAYNLFTERHEALVRETRYAWRDKIAWRDAARRALRKLYGRPEPGYRNPPRNGTVPPPRTRANRARFARQKKNAKKA